MTCVRCEPCRRGANALETLPSMLCEASVLMFLSHRGGGGLTSCPELVNGTFQDSFTSRYPSFLHLRMGSSKCCHRRDRSRKKETELTWHGRRRGSGGAGGETVSLGTPPGLQPQPHPGEGLEDAPSPLRKFSSLRGKRGMPSALGYQGLSEFLERLRTGIWCMLLSDNTNSLRISHMASSQKCLLILLSSQDWAFPDSLDKEEGRFPSAPV